MHTIINVEPKPDFSLLLTFETGEIRCFDANPYLDKGVFIRLKDYTLFAQVCIVDGTVLWCGNMDLCPDMLYEHSKSVSYPEVA